MNLSLILNLPAGNAPANPANAPVVQGQATAEMASFQDFLSLMGLPPMAAHGPTELPAGDQLAANPAALAAMVPGETGNVLPPDLPPLPDPAAIPADPASLFQPAAVQTAGTLSPANGQPASPEHFHSAPPVPQVPQPKAGPAATGVLAGSLPLPPGSPAVAVAQAAPAQGSVAIDLPLNLAGSTQLQPQAAAQVAAQPVLAQLLQAAPRPAPRKAGDEVVAATVASTSAADVPSEASRPAAPAPVLPVAAAAAPMSDITSAQPGTGAVTSPAAATTERHDFTAVIDKLAEARELARPGRADMHVAHREFGQVSVQFELAGQALKVAMSSADPGFAPAVQAALAERPVAAVADAARADSQSQRSDTVNASTASWQAGPQADGQRQDGQHRTQQARPGHAPVRHNDSDSDSAGGTASGRDGSRFA